jgi:cysteinyl-tRNA synthetase
MKNNTERVKHLLTQAMQAWPDDFTLAEARSYLRTCLQKIEQVESRRNKQGQAEKTQAQKWWGTLTNNVQNPLNVQQTLGAIDDMIAEEYKKLEAIAERKRQKQAVKEDDDGGDFSILG